MRRFLLEKDPAAGAVTVQANDRQTVKRGDEGTEPLDLSGLPRFAPPAASLSTLLAATLPALALLACASLLAFGGAVAAFARYDAR